VRSSPAPCSMRSGSPRWSGGRHITMRPPARGARHRRYVAATIEVVKRRLTGCGAPPHLAPRVAGPLVGAEATTPPRGRREEEVVIDVPADLSPQISPWILPWMKRSPRGPRCSPAPCSTRRIRHQEEGIAVDRGTVGLAVDEERFCRRTSSERRKIPPPPPRKPPQGHRAEGEEAEADGARSSPAPCSHRRGWRARGNSTRRDGFGCLKSELSVFVSAKNVNMDIRICIRFTFLTWMSDGCI
jgi:hypothetical protein